MCWYGITSLMYHDMVIYWYIVTSLLVYISVWKEWFHNDYVSCNDHFITTFTLTTHHNNAYKIPYMYVCMYVLYIHRYYIVWKSCFIDYNGVIRTYNLLCKHFYFTLSTYLIYWSRWVTWYDHITITVSLSSLPSLLQ